MRLQISRTKNAASFYVVKSVRVNGHSTSKVVEKLGTEKELIEKLNGQDPLEWAKAYVEELNRKEKEDSREVLVKYSPVKPISKDEQHSFNGGYLFLQSIYHKLGIDRICKDITERHKFKFDLNSILSRLLYSRILYPSSKLNTFKLSSKFIEAPNFDLHQIYRALDVIEEESDFIQSELYKNSMKLSNRNTGIIYYDCTNYFFETNYSEGLMQYGYSKQHQPKPLVQMGLFMDADGIPLAFNITPGNTNEQVTLRPTEKKIINDFELSKFVMCTDAGLASEANKRFNTKGERAFITTQSIKKLKGPIKQWALDPAGWHAENGKKKLTIEQINRAYERELKKEEQTGDSKDRETLENAIFYKSRPMDEDNLEQTLIVSFSLKYRNYQRKIRNEQIARAERAIANNPGKIGKAKKNDYKRFIKKVNVTVDGEIADNVFYQIDNSVVSEEEQYDGLYGMCTNLNDSPSEIFKVNKRRWQIEECFRIMKAEFKARPVFHQNDSRISAHFTTCFLSLILFRYFEKEIEEKYTCNEIVGGLRDMSFYKVTGEGYIPTYTRNDFTDDVHDAFGFRTDFEVVGDKKMKNILKTTKK